MIYNLKDDDIFHDFIYGTPDEKSIKKFNSWLRAHKEDELELYHGTGSKVPISDQGIKRTRNSTKKSIQSQTGYVYLSIFPKMSEMFGSMAYPYDTVAVYAVTIKIKFLEPDKDQLRNKQFYGQYEEALGHTLADSFVYGHGARTKQHIWPYMLRKLEDSEI